MVGAGYVRSFPGALKLTQIVSRPRDHATPVNTQLPGSQSRRPDSHSLRGVFGEGDRVSGGSGRIFDHQCLVPVSFLNRARGEDPAAVAFARNAPGGALEHILHYRFCDRDRYGY